MRNQQGPMDGGNQTQRDYLPALQKLPATPQTKGPEVITYLAVPYSHPDASVRKYRFQVANQIAAGLMREGQHVFSPISHTHPIALAGDLPTDWAYWEQYDRAMLSICGKLLIIRLDGWTESHGIRGEIAIAEELGIPVEYMDL